MWLLRAFSFERHGKYVVRTLVADGTPYADLSTCIAGGMVLAMLAAVRRDKEDTTYLGSTH